MNIHQFKNKIQNSSMFELFFFLSPISQNPINTDAPVFSLIPVMNILMEED
jgi:hypothetical protein